MCAFTQQITCRVASDACAPSSHRVNDYRNLGEIVKSVLNHVSFLVESIESVMENSSFSDDSIGKVKEFPGEGTRELYIDNDNQMGRLLLMQAIGDGPYKRALEKRGAGLHHIALDVEDIDSFVDQLNSSGWQLHPKSLSFYNKNRQVYL